MARPTGLRSDTPPRPRLDAAFSSTSELARKIATELALDPDMAAITVAEHDGWVYLRGTLLKPDEWQYLSSQARIAGFRPLGKARTSGWRRAESVAAKATQDRLDAEREANKSDLERAFDADREELYAEYQREEDAYRLREWRESHGWTQADAARECGYSLDTWKSYETGRLPVSARALKMVELIGAGDAVD